MSDARDVALRVIRQGPAWRLPRRALQMRHHGIPLPPRTDMAAVLSAIKVAGDAIAELGDERTKKLWARALQVRDEMLAGLLRCRVCRRLLHMARFPDVPARVPGGIRQDCAECLPWEKQR
jgi:hypothetical protein